MNYNLEDVILEKYVEGVIDDEHYLSLYEYVAGGTAIPAVGFKIANDAVHKEQVQSFEKAKKSYKENMAAAKQFIKHADGTKAKSAIDKALKDIDECYKIVEDADEDLVGWFVQHEAISFKRAFVAEVIGIGMSLMIGFDLDDAAKGKLPDDIPHAKEKGITLLVVGGAAGIASIAMIIKDCKKLLNYRYSAKNLGSALSLQRANMLDTLDKCKKNLKKLQNKIK